MENSVLDAAAQAMFIVGDPYRLLLLACGVFMGLSLGAIPGIGGLVGMSLLMPFTYGMDSYTAFALLLGMIACTNTSDTLPAVLFGVPGSAAAQATVMDGNPMAKRGEAGRALAAAYTASMIGGVVGAIMLGVAIPVIRPVILYIGSPELLALSIFGIAMVALLAGRSPLRGLIVAGIGVMLSMVGTDPQTGSLRWTLGEMLYLWDGIPLVPLIMGLFALPELADLFIRRTSTAMDSKYDIRTGLMLGVKDTLRNWFLALRCSAFGCLLGAIPGVGGSVIDWLAYGHALQTEKDARKTFGTGDVRGVIAPESANNSDTAGALFPTMAFGVPGSASMAVLLGAFLIQGIVPGPAMVTKHLDLAYSMVWSIALANIIGAGTLLLFSGQFAKIATLRYTLVLPLILTLVFVGAYQVSQSWGDLFALLIFGVVGWLMKQLRWPRPPLILGFVLGAIIERYMFISVSRYDMAWVFRPMVFGLLVLTLFTVLSPIIRDLRTRGGGKFLANFGPPKFAVADLFPVALICIFVVMLADALQWSRFARLGPVAVVSTTLVITFICLGNQILRRGAQARALADGTAKEASTDISHLDLSTDMTDLTTGGLLGRSALFLGWLLLFLGLFAVFGIFVTIPIFLIVFMRVEGPESWKTVSAITIVFTVATYLMFQYWLNIRWPDALIGQWLPFLQVVPGI